WGSRLTWRRVGFALVFLPFDLPQLGDELLQRETLFRHVCRSLPVIQSLCSTRTEKPGQLKVDPLDGRFKSVKNGERGINRVKLRLPRLSVQAAATCHLCLLVPAGGLRSGHRCPPPGPVEYRGSARSAPAASNRLAARSRRRERSSGGFFSRRPRRSDCPSNAETCLRCRKTCSRGG